MLYLLIVIMHANMLIAYANGQLFVCHVTQIQEFRTGATRQNMETVHAKEESKRLRAQLTELRDKLNDLEARVRSP